jgi:Ssp1 endopeptidase immunity protein Rap1a
VKAWVCLLMLLATPAFAETALEMQSECASFRSANLRGNMVEFDQTFDTGVCWGAFAAIQAATVTTGANNDRLLGVCPSPESTRVEFIKIFLRRVDEHPEVGHLNFWPVALNALIAAFPCKASN